MNESKALAGVALQFLGFPQSPLVPFGEFTLGKGQNLGEKSLQN